MSFHLCLSVQFLVAGEFLSFFMSFTVCGMYCSKTSKNLPKNNKEIKKCASPLNSMIARGSTEKNVLI